MQDIFGNDNNSVEQIVKSLSAPRLTKYLEVSKGNTMLALDLYRWNASLSQSLYTYVQAWEICLRNKLNSFFIWKYNANWPYDARFVRNLNGSDRKKVHETIQRQESDRGMSPVNTPAVVADLSAGFWVAQLSYDIPYTWRHNISKIFPHDAISASDARSICTDILGIRNRIAHHEPIFNQPLQQRHSELKRMVAGMCDPTFRYAESMCSFTATLAKRPE